MAIGHAYDGLINVVFGTHTHVPTCDEVVLPRGTGYITDVGMCGESGGVLGMDVEAVIKQMRNRTPPKFQASTGPCKATGAIFDLDTSSGKVTSITRVTI